MIRFTNPFRVISFISLLLILNFFSACTDPCEDVVCYNFGTCVDGECACPPGYIGEDCTENLTPIRMKINNIRVTKMPTWAINDTAIDLNLYITVSKRGFDTLYVHPTSYMNADPFQDYDFTPSGGIYLDSLNDGYYIQLFSELDSGRPGFFLEGLGFTPNQRIEKIPNPLFVQNGMLTCRLDVTYFFE